MKDYQTQETDVPIPVPTSVNVGRGGDARGPSSRAKGTDRAMATDYGRGLVIAIEGGSSLV